MFVSPILILVLLRRSLTFGIAGVVVGAVAVLGAVLSFLTATLGMPLFLGGVSIFLGLLTYVAARQDNKPVDWAVGAILLGLAAIGMWAFALFQSLSGISFH